MPGLSLQNMRDGVRRALGVDSDDDGFDDTGVDSYLDRSWWEISDMFNFKERESDAVTNTVIGAISIAVLADLDHLQKVSIQDLYSDQHTPLDEMNLQDYETNYVDRTEARGKPTHYIRRAGELILWPTPDAIYEVITYYRSTLADIAAAGVDIPKAWHELIMLGGAWRGAVDLGDVKKKKLLKETQMELMSTKETTDVKEKANRPYAGVTMIRPRYR